jgi:hypothetical protein
MNKPFRNYDGFVIRTKRYFLSPCGDAINKLYQIEI